MNIFKYNWNCHSLGLHASNWHYLLSSDHVLKMLYDDSFRAINLSDGSCEHTRMKCSPTTWTNVCSIEITRSARARNGTCQAINGMHPRCQCFFNFLYHWREESSWSEWANLPSTPESTHHPLGSNLLQTVVSNFVWRAFLCFRGRHNIGASAVLIYTLCSRYHSLEVTVRKSTAVSTTLDTLNGLQRPTVVLIRSCPNLQNDRVSDVVQYCTASGKWRQQGQRST